MTTETPPMYCDISVWNGPVNWPEYRAWAAQWDGIARVAMKATEGVGFTDPRFAQYRAGALAAGVDEIVFYHFARPDLGNSASAEAGYFHSVVGDIRPADFLMLDYEVSKPQATAAWAYGWLEDTQANYGGKLSRFYSYDAYIRARMQDSRLIKYPLILAFYEFTPTERPPCPPPWTEYEALQWTDRDTNVPGIAGKVDANVYLHLGETMITIDTSNPEVASHFQKVSETEWHCVTTGQNVHSGVLTFYRSFGNSKLCGLTYLGLPLSPELPLQGSKHGAVMQHFECGVVAWDPAHEFDTRPGGIPSDEAYLLKVYSGPGQDPRVQQAQDQITQLQNQIKVLQNQPAQDAQSAQQIASLQGQLTALQTQIGHYQENNKQIALLVGASV